MSWEAENNSAGSPTTYDQITAPQRTPTSAKFGDDLYGTPRVGTEALDSSGSSPVFAEDYTLFNATPGRFTNDPTFGTLSPRPTAASRHKRQHSSTETLRIDRTSSIRGGQTLRSAGLGASSGLPSPPTARSPVVGGGLDKLTKSTPTTSSRVTEATIGQTATPPQSKHKHARRASLADAENKMQNEQDFYNESGGVGGGYDLSFASPTNEDLFSFPMPGPATAPAYMNGKSFWDPSNGMTDMSMDFADPFSASGDWIENGDMFQQQSMGTPQAQQSSTQSSRKPRPLMAKPLTSSMPPVQSGVTFDFGMASLGEYPFTMPSTSVAVDPNSLFRFPNLTPPLPSNAAFNTTSLQANSQLESQPQPSLLSPLNIPRSQSAQSKRPDPSHRPMLRPVSPLKGNKPNARRPTNNNLGRPPALKSAALLSSDVQPPPNFAGKGRYSSGTGTGNVASGRRSPTKQGSHTNLQAIPERGVTEKLFNPRTAVTFSIDANGRARTETTVIMETHEQNETRPRTAGSNDSRPSPRDEETMSGSSTDEEVIVIPSRNPSFAQKDKNRALAMPKMARFETGVKQYPRAVSGGRKLSAGNVKALSKAAFALDDDTDEEEVIDTTRHSGDASKALRRVMENRRRSVSGITSMPPTSNVSTIRISSSHRASNQDKDRHNRRQSYAASATYSTSTPSTGTDFDGDMEMLGADTPSTVESQVTRCVCHRKEKMDDEFMIQCESCEHWQHSTCVKIDPRELPKVYICAFCAQTPNMRGGRRDRLREREREVVLEDRENLLGRFR